MELGGLLKMLAKENERMSAFKTARFEHPAKRTMIELAPNQWDLAFSQSAQEWIDNDAEAPMWFRYDPERSCVVICADSPVDLDLFFTAF